MTSRRAAALALPLVAAAKAAYPNLPADLIENHPLDPQAFVTALAGIVTKYHMENRTDIQSFDFRTLKLTQEQFSRIPTYYLTNNAKSFTLDFVYATAH
jgi:glycerophosphoryl diester phosphodiesterase